MFNWRLKTVFNGLERARDLVLPSFALRILSLLGTSIERAFHVKLCGLTPCFPNWIIYDFNWRLKTVFNGLERARDLVLPSFALRILSLLGTSIERAFHVKLCGLTPCFPNWIIYDFNWRLKTVFNGLESARDLVLPSLALRISRFG